MPPDHTRFRLIARKWSKGQDIPGINFEFLKDWRELGKICILGVGENRLTSNDILLDKANEALGVVDVTAADKLYEDLVNAIEEVRGKNQKEVAAELQRLARAIESEGRTDDSMRLKQRTCEVMLRMSMAERHRGRMPLMRPPGSGSGHSVQSPVRKLAFLYVGTQSLANELAWLKGSLGAVETRRLEESGREYVFLSVPNSVPLMVAEDEIVGPWLSVFEADNPDQAIDQIRQQWTDLLKEEARVPGGKLTWLRSHTRRFGFIATSCLRQFLAGTTT